MDKLSVLCVTQFVERFNTDNAAMLFDLVQDISGWLTNSVRIIAELESFNDVQRELLGVAQYIAQGKVLTRRSVNKLFVSVKLMQKEMLSELEVVLFVTPSIKMKFNENVRVITIEDTEKCIDMAYEIQDAIKYLLYMDNEEVDEELEDAVDIVLDFEELIKVANDAYPIDIFTYDRLYLTAKLNKVQKEKSRILLTGSSYTMVGLLEDEMPYKVANVAVNAQDLYYTLLSAKEAINRSSELDIIVSSFAYYFFFSDMNDNPSDYMLSVLSKVNYPVYNKLHGYNEELKPIFVKTSEFPIYENIVDLALVRDAYHGALMKELEGMPYYNRINVRASNGMLSYNFTEKTDEQNYAAARLRAEGHNSNFNLDRGVYNQKLLDKFLDNMEELGKRVILFTPPTTVFYKAGVSKDMVNAYTQLVMPVVEKHKCCTFLDLYNSDKFLNSDFQDYDHLNLYGAKKLSKIIASYIIEEYKK